MTLAFCSLKSKHSVPNLMKLVRCGLILPSVWPLLRLLGLCLHRHWQALPYPLHLVQTLCILCKVK